MSRPAEPYRSPKLFLLLFRLEVLILAAILSAAFFAAAAVLNDTTAPWLMAVTAALGEGLLLGACSRLFFRRRSVPLQWAAGCAAAALSQIVLGWLTGGLAGVDPVGSLRSGPDWAALVYVLIGAIAVTWAAAWGRVRYPPPPIVPSEILESEAAASAGKKKSRKKNKAAKERRPLGQKIRSALPFLRNRRGDAEIRLVGAEEHKCPYCLQPVSPHDPRGVVTCPICKTRHHKDCWDITGMCQVPHYHT
jgi:hypothetical protein